jgi:hypothetical protein
MKLIFDYVSLIEDKINYVEKFEDYDEVDMTRNDNRVCSSTSVNRVFKMIKGGKKNEYAENENLETILG